MDVLLFVCRVNEKEEVTDVITYTQHKVEQVGGCGCILYYKSHPILASLATTYVYSSFWLFIFLFFWFVFLKQIKKIPLKLRQLGL